MPDRLERTRGIFSFAAFRHAATMPRRPRLVRFAFFLAALTASAWSAARAADANPFGDAPARAIFADVFPAGRLLERDAGGGIDRLCSASEGLLVGFGLQRLEAADLGLCRRLGRGGIFQRRIGSVVVAAFAAPAFAPNLTSAQLHDAIAAEAEGGPKPPTRWREIDPSLPDEPIRILLPPRDSAEFAVLRETVLLKGCLKNRGPRLPVQAAARQARCSELRADGAVRHAGPGGEVGPWLASAGPGAVAFAGYGRVVAEPSLRFIVPIDGALPTRQAIAAAEYPAASALHLIATLKTPVQAASRDPSVALADLVLSEGVIGPTGKAAKAGLAPLSAEERVALRADFATFLQRAGTWE